jgi:hypothetical protein
MVYAEWQVGQLFWSMLWFAVFFMWIWVLIVVFGDIFRSHDLGGWAKALWTVFVIFLPVLGVLAYLIARGNKIGQHEVDDAQRADQAMRAYIRDTVATPADDQTTLADLRARGIIDDAEYQAMSQRAGNRAGDERTAPA